MRRPTGETGKGGVLTLGVVKREVWQDERWSSDEVMWCRPFPVVVVDIGVRLPTFVIVIGVGAGVVGGGLAWSSIFQRQLQSSSPRRQSSSSPLPSSSSLPLIGLVFTAAVERG